MNNRFNYNEPKRFAVFRSRDKECFYITVHKEVSPMGYVDSLEEFERYVKMEYPNAKRLESLSSRGSGSYYFSDENYNIFYHELRKLNAPL